MTYKLQIRPAAQREFRKLPRQVQDRLKPLIDSLTENPFPHGCKKLSGEDSLYRVRAGAFRVIYQVKDAVRIVVIVRVGHRRYVYRSGFHQLPEDE